ncbi:MAG: DUF1844 domain-containing protein [Acidobacteriota bacterium]
MSDTPKFEVIDRRKYKAEEEEHAQSEQASATTPAAPAPDPGAKAGPRLVTEASKPAAESLPTEAEAEETSAPELPPPPTAEESRQQKSAYDASAQRLEDLVRAQNPGVGPQPPVTFDQLVQQLYLSAMLQMGAGTQEGQRPRVDIVGARQTIDLLGVLAEKTKGNLTPEEDRILQTMLFEARMGFLELTNMITMQAMQPPTPPPGAGKR